MASFMKCVFFTNINFCYPVNVRSTLMAFSSLVSLSLLWSQSYIVACIQLEDSIAVYFYSQLAIGIFVLILTPVIFLRIVSLDPGVIRQLDQIRVDANSATIPSQQRRVSVAVGIDYYRTTSAENSATADIREISKTGVVGVTLRQSFFKRRASIFHIQ